MRRRKYLFKRLIDVVSPLRLCDYNLKYDKIQNREKIPPPKFLKTKNKNKTKADKSYNWEHIKQPCHNTESPQCTMYTSRKMIMAR